MVCQLIQDHPRRCGENKEAQAIKVLCTGSPPQVRGKREKRRYKRTFCGITPAGAGKTWRAFEHGELNEDHPRRCGENAVKLEAVHQAEGSPPQVRGKPLCCRHRDLRSRITPAGAGKTWAVYARTI